MQFVKEWILVPVKRANKWASTDENLNPVVRYNICMAVSRVNSTSLTFTFMEIVIEMLFWWFDPLDFSNGILVMKQLHSLRDTDNVWYEAGKRYQPFVNEFCSHNLKSDSIYNTNNI